MIDHQHQDAHDLETIVPPRSCPRPRRLMPTIPLQKIEGSPFTLAESIRTVTLRPIKRAWLRAEAVELGPDDAAVLERIVSCLVGLAVDDTSRHTRRGGRPNHYELSLYRYFGAELEANGRAERALRRLLRDGVVVRVLHHILEIDGDEEVVRRITWYVPTMRAVSAISCDAARSTVASFWKDRCLAGHAFDDRRVDVSKAVRHHVFAHYGRRCQARGRWYEHERCSNRRAPELDHILARALGGPDHAWNLRPLCHECNTRKGANPPRDPRHASAKPTSIGRNALRPPRRSKFNSRELDELIAARDPNYVSPYIDRSAPRAPS
ncbi:MAG: endonuclease [Thermoleophilia bacterium]|nr:endonuclease [Thermoleophilia bacterium]